MIKWEDTTALFIKDVVCQLQGDEYVINWHWAEDVPCVYVHRSGYDEPFDVNQLGGGQLKLYTREEYKAHKGLREKNEGIGRYTYRIFPCRLENGKPVMLLPRGEAHIVHVRTGKAKIYYSFKRGRNWFSSYQSLQIRIFSEIPIPKEALCYVKKEGAIPANKDDGTQYAFIRDMQPGVNLLPEIEVRKKDEIRLFFTDGKKYGELYELIPE
ncbi:beta-mannanase [Brevibacillus choshinensis]|uniref:Beta-mannanase n=1 Tax=Brevibacillus choshinensis TaxID=54911 RepID=A0ABX7FQM4_BRECH|nr:beta-mannanase [Brevibacillus choshinensis]QRG67597.1 beta-mannanase [Brevibacillus choshinensis]